MGPSYGLFAAAGLTMAFPAGLSHRAHYCHRQAEAGLPLRDVGRPWVPSWEPLPVSKKRLGATGPSGSDSSRSCHRWRCRPDCSSAMDTAGSQG